MNNPQHTQGRWFIYDDGHGHFQVRAQTPKPPVAVICEVLGAEWSKEGNKANARLIAAAPEMFKALRDLYTETADYIRINKLGDAHHNRSMQMARDALAKAEGK